MIGVMKPSVIRRYQYCGAALNPMRKGGLVLRRGKPSKSNCVDMSERRVGVVARVRRPGVYRAQIGKVGGCIWYHDQGNIAMKLLLLEKRLIYGHVPEKLYQ